MREAEDEERARVHASNERYLAEQERKLQQRRDTPLLANPHGARILVLGMLDSGKSSFMRWLLTDGSEVKVAEPTLGVQIEEVEASHKCNAPEGLSALSWGGCNATFRREMRPMLEYLYGGADGLPSVRGIVWIVDAAFSTEERRADDKWADDKWADTKDLLSWYLANPKLSGLPLLVLANKRDKPSAISAEDVARRMGLIGDARRSEDDDGLVACSEGFTKHGGTWGLQHVVNLAARQPGYGRGYDLALKADVRHVSTK